MTFQNPHVIEFMSLISRLIITHGTSFLLIRKSFFFFFFLVVTIKPLDAYSYSFFGFRFLLMEKMIAFEAFSFYVLKEFGVILPNLVNYERSSNFI